MADKVNPKLQAYLDAIQAKTGKTPQDLHALAAQKGLTKAAEIVAWLKSEYGLGYGHSGAISYLLLHADDAAATSQGRLAKLFSGGKAKWRKPYETLAAKISKFGSDVELTPNMTYINVMRRGKKFAIVQPSAAERLDIGIKRKGIAPTERFQPASSWNNMVTHRIRIHDPKDIDKEVVEWLKSAYTATQVSSKKV